MMPIGCRSVRLRVAKCAREKPSIFTKTSTPVDLFTPVHTAAIVQQYRKCAAESPGVSFQLRRSLALRNRLHSGSQTEISPVQARPSQLQILQQEMQRHRLLGWLVDNGYKGAVNYTPAVRRCGSSLRPFTRSLTNMRL